jgi:hypothetical protein
MKHTLLFGFFAFLIQTAYSQVTKGWYFTPEIGISVAQATGSDVVKSSFLNYGPTGPSSYFESYYVNDAAGSKFKIGWLAGLGIERRLSTFLSLKTAFWYENKGNYLPLRTKEYITIDPDPILEETKVEGTARNNYHYLTIPLLAKFHIKNVYLLGGLYQSILLSTRQTGRFKIHPSGQNDPTIYNHSSKDSRLRTGDTGFWLGGGYQRSLANGNILFSEIRWQRSIASVGSRDMVPDQQQVYNQSFTLSVGYQLKL